MTPALLREAGEALYGSRWQSELARALPMGLRRLQRIAAGKPGYPIPEGVGPRVRALLRERGLAMAKVRRKLPR